MIEDLLKLYRCKKCKKYFCTDKERRISSPCCKHRATHILIGEGYRVGKSQFNIKGRMYTIYYEVDKRQTWEINPKTKVSSKGKRKSRNNERVEYKNES